jgi:hypothetical protein
MKTFAFPLSVSGGVPLVQVRSRSRGYERAPSAAFPPSLQPATAAEINYRLRTGDDLPGGGRSSSSSSVSDISASSEGLALQPDEGD